MRHATPTAAGADAEAVAAIAVDSTGSAIAMPPSGRPPYPTYGTDSRRKNLGGRGGGRGGARAAPKGDGPRKLRLLDKPKTKYDDIDPNVQTALGSDPRVGIASKAEWEARGGMVCPLCPARDHDLWRCVKVWASTAAGQKWLGSAKAAEIVSRMHGNNTMMVSELVLNIDQLCFADTAMRSALADSTMYVCEYCNVPQEGHASTDAADILAVVSALACEGGDLVAAVMDDADDEQATPETVDATRQ